MNIDLLLKTKVAESLNKIGIECDVDSINIAASKDKSHGDYACNAAMRFASQLKENPRMVAEKIVENINKDGIDHIEIAGPGFINFFMKNDSLTNIIKKIIDEGSNYGNGEKKPGKVNVEFVSANPTGELHLGHARGAALGDSLVRILEKAGYDVTREYYINDAGNQINNLAKSIDARYQNLFGRNVEITDDMYHGEDIIEIAKGLKELNGDKYLDNKDALSYFKKEGMRIELEKIIRDLQDFRVKFDVFSYETKVRSNNAVEKEIANLKPYIYNDGDALVLRTTDFLDDKDRVIVKSNGDYTYFLPDIVYHLDKLSRGYTFLIDLLGADHHGYINRMKSALMMHGYSKDVLDIELIQMVRIFQDGEEIKLSKRTGKTITLRELCQEVGIDAVRYFFVARSADSHLDFNINLAREQSSSNPVYYAQYAYARLYSVLKNEDKYGIDLSGALIKEEKELSLLKVLMEYPNIIEATSASKEPCILTNYIQKLATSIHSFYTECRVIDQNNPEMSKARLALCKAAAIVMKDALNLIGVEAPQEM